MRERVVVTGTSLVCSLGASPEEAANRLLEGGSGLNPCGLEALGVKEAAWFGEVGADLKQALGGKGWRNHNRAALMACLAARELRKESGLEQAWRPEDAGLVMGYNHNIFSEEFVETIRNQNLSLLNPAFFLNISTNATASQVTIYLKAQAFAMTVTTGFTAGLEALDQAALALRAGRARWVMAGGAEERNEQFRYSFHQAFRRNADAGQATALRLGAPNQITAGEGCGLMMLETEGEARARGARVLGGLLGSGMGVNPGAKGGDPAAAEAALRQALKQAGLEARDVSAVFVAGNGHASQDQAEAKALERVFGGNLPPATALKGALGETYHAHGTLAAVLALECLRQGRIPGTLNLGDAGLAQRINLNREARAVSGKRAVVLALEQDRKAAALVLEAA
ncbi:MAG: beta-ketoacyl synthase N-terminal-like domain-containing protein [candidate division FCPU426 bacterium]